MPKADFWPPHSIAWMHTGTPTCAHTHIHVKQFTHTMNVLGGEHLPSMSKAMDPVPGTAKIQQKDQPPCDVNAVFTERVRGLDRQQLSDLCGPFSSLPITFQHPSNLPNTENGFYILHVFCCFSTSDVLATETCRLWEECLSMPGGGGGVTVQLLKVLEAT